jgi:hypothetical protein
LFSESITLVVVVAIGLAVVASFVLFRDAHLDERSIDRAAAKALVERIIIAESNGDRNAKNKRSSATQRRLTALVRCYYSAANASQVRS